MSIFSTQKLSVINFIRMVLFLGCLFSACTPNCNDCQNQLKGTEFFPLEVGYFVEYDVNEEEINLGRPAIVRQYQLKDQNCPFSPQSR
jgi:hypothetical protein